MYREQDGIRKGYWAVHDMAVGNEKLSDEDLPMMISPSHIRHCIDLLRNGLICNPDLTVEVKDKMAGGVHGFGTKHSCVNWPELVAWTTRWELKSKMG